MSYLKHFICHGQVLQNSLLFHVLSFSFSWPCLGRALFCSWQYSSTMSFFLYWNVLSYSFIHGLVLEFIHVYWCLKETSLTLSMSHISSCPKRSMEIWTRKPQSKLFPCCLTIIILWLKADISHSGGTNFYRPSSFKNSYVKKLACVFKELF